VNREMCKFLSGTFAGVAYAHVGYAVATSAGIINEPVGWRPELQQSASARDGRSGQGLGAPQEALLVSR
jgi:hypothetical protein